MRSISNETTAHGIVGIERIAFALDILKPHKISV